jgi:hypothetical protein
MSKRLGNLERLHRKLSAALGRDHPHVLQLQIEIESFAANSPPTARCESTQRRSEMGRSVNHRWKYLGNPSAYALAAPGDLDG